MSMELKIKPTINFGGYDIPREILLCALYEYARVQGNGFLQAVPGPLKLAIAKEIFADHDAAEQTTANSNQWYRGYRPLYVDYFRGRVMKVHFDEPLDLGLYVRDNGNQAVQSALNFALDMMTRPEIKP